MVPTTANDAEPNLSSPVLGFDLATVRTFASLAPAQLLTAQFDNARTGANLNERILTPANVNAAQFGAEPYSPSLRVDWPPAGQLSEI